MLQKRLLQPAQLTVFGQTFYRHDRFRADLGQW